MNPRPRQTPQADRGGSAPGPSLRAAPGRGIQPWLSGLLLVLATGAVYIGVWHAGFIWDDNMHLTQNPCIVGPLGLLQVWTTRYARICPLVFTTFWAEHLAWGLNPLPYHLINVLLHGASAVVLWRVLLRLGVPGAWLGAALWAVHPVQAETVAWVTELKNTQSCLFYLLSVLFFSRWVVAGKESARRGWGGYFLALGAAALAMASKSSTVILPLVLALCAWWLGERRKWRIAFALAPMLLFSIAASCLALWTQGLEGANEPQWALGWASRAVVAGKVFWFYLGKLLWPHPLLFIYPRWSLRPDSVAAYLPTAALCAAFILLWRGKDGVLRPFFFALAYFGAALLPVLGLANQFFLRFSFVGDHFQYLASIGPLALIASLVTCALDRIGFASFKPAVAGILLAILGAVTWVHSKVFVNSQALWTSTVAGNPGCWLAYNNLGFLSLSSGQAGEAEVYFRKALEVGPREADTETNLGEALYREGQVAEAEQWMKAAVAVDPNYAAAHAGLAQVYMQSGRDPEAATEYREALRIGPATTDVLINLGTLELQRGESDEAVRLFSRALAFDPGDIIARTNLANAFLKKGLPDDAIAQYKAALVIDPKSPQVRYGLGISFFGEGRLEEAAAEFREAVNAKPDYAEAHNALGFALFQGGRVDEAIAEYNKAIAINPDYALAHKNLGTALFKKGNLEGAEAEIGKSLKAQ